MIAQRVWWATVCIALASTAAATTSELATCREDTFDHYPSEARADTLARRLMTPLTYRTLFAGIRRTGVSMRQEQVLLADERYLVRIPGRRPPAGYGVLVFIPPWPEAQLPRGWGSVLDRAGIIFVSAERSGNEASVVSRRQPLALIAAANVRRRYVIDDSRTYIGGFSGGARVAMRLAVAYPDVFAGALLDAGSDPVGTFDAPLPEGSMLSRVQESSGFALLTGDGDVANLEKDKDTMRSLRANCVGRVKQFTGIATGHEPVGPEELRRALRFLDDQGGAKDEKLGECRSAISKQLAARLSEIERDIADGRIPAAVRKLDDVDHRYAGLASSDLQRLAELIERQKR